MTHYTSADVYTDKNKAAGYARFLLEAGDTAVNVTTTKEHREIKGPSIADYQISPAGTIQSDYPYAEGSLKALGAALTAMNEREEKQPDADGPEWETWAESALDAAWEVKRHAQAIFDMFNHGFYTAQPNPENIPPR